MLTSPKQVRRGSITLTSISMPSLRGVRNRTMLTDYEVTPPNLPNTGSVENYLKELKAGYRIMKDNQTVTLSLEEMNRFENEVCDFVELKLKHLFKQKGVDING